LTNGFNHAGPDSWLSPDTNIPHHSNNQHSPQETPIPIARGVINDISVFERGERGKDGVCIVVALGKEHRLGRWAGVRGGKNGAVVFEVPRVGRVNGVNGVIGGVDGDMDGDGKE
jgi:ribosomal RNA-processing protein 9